MRKWIVDDINTILYFPVDYPTGKNNSDNIFLDDNGRD